MRAAITRTCNITISDDSWLQASLPIRMGGIGVRRMEDVALPAYISSMSATQELVRQTNGRSRDDEPDLLMAALNTFRDHHCPDYDINPNDETPLRQRQLDEAACRHRLEALLERSNQVHRARLLAAAAPHSGAWLDAIPVESLGLLLPDDAVRVGVALRLGTPVCLPHRCRCGHAANNLSHHQLSCHRDPCRMPIAMPALSILSVV